MKNLISTFVLVLVLVSCKKETKSTTESSDQKTEVVTSAFPENISKVFKAHGSIEAWNANQSLAFTMKKEAGDEVTLTNLKSRESLIIMPNHTVGFDGKQAWLLSKEGQEYKGNAKFYYNLMFYFYAMPFILADDGIIYSKVEPLSFEGKNYPGIKVGYKSGVGESPEDEYILYYNPETYKMEWLGYTVTYFTKEKSKKWSFIRYSNWQTVDGLVLPETLTWYKVENNLPIEVRNDLKFTDIKLSKTAASKELFLKPESAIVAE